MASFFLIGLNENNYFHQKTHFVHFFIQLNIAWTGSISYGLQCIFCIIGSILVDLFNPRLIGVAGGLISAISMVLSAWVNEIKYYLLTYGLLLSIGQALLLASTLSILPHYFDKKLSLANGKSFMTQL